MVTVTFTYKQHEILHSLFCGPSSLLPRFFRRHWFDLVFFRGCICWYSLEGLRIESVNRETRAAGAWSLFSIRNGAEKTLMPSGQPETMGLLLLFLKECHDFFF